MALESSLGRGPAVSLWLKPKAAPKNGGTEDWRTTAAYLTRHRPEAWRICTQPRNSNSTMAKIGKRFGAIVFISARTRQLPRHQPTFLSLLRMAATFLSLPRTPYAWTCQWSYKFVNRKPRGVHPARILTWHHWIGNQATIEEFPGKSRSMP